MASPGSAGLPQKIVLDVDTGVDDALAIFMAAKSPELKVEALTTVVGNVSLEKVLRNTLHVARLSGMQGVPVHRGLAAPIASAVPQDASFVHGSDGLGDSNLPEPTNRPAEGFAPDVLCELAGRLGEELVVVTTGPLSNLAMAVRKAPEAMKKVRLHVMMGGAFSLTPYGHGNMTPAAEFNIWHDPEAAKVVFDAGLPTVAVGLDVTTDPAALMTEDHLRRLESRGEAGALVQKVAAACFKAGGQLHDPMAVGYVLAPSLFKTEDFDVDVEVHGTVTRGETVADRRGRWRKFRLPGTVPKGKAKVCTAVDGKGFLELFMSRLSAF
jgi:inosine-uridine nucleoside N-ribohydrolase